MQLRGSTAQRKIVKEMMTNAKAEGGRATCPRLIFDVMERLAQRTPSSRFEASSIFSSPFSSALSRLSYCGLSCLAT